jgi:NADH dehydrogenase (ubiquinone) Fe-S protein 1
MHTNLVKISINNMPIEVPSTFTVLQACEQASVEIPRFCYHEKLSVAGNCRMCLVEIVKSPKPVVSCAMPVMPNMEIFTDTPLVKKSREAIIEFLLMNHPLDCPICDQGGECDSQDQTLSFGSDRSRFYENKRSVEDKECGPIIKTIMTRCIHCTRCIRFSAEISGEEELGVIGRGNQTEIGTYVQRFIRSEISGNMVDLCPVGALTSKPYAFLSRNWELTRKDSIDFFDAICSNINVQTRQSSTPHKLNSNKQFLPKDTLLRVLPRKNDLVNETWISNKTRYNFDGLLQNRIETPFFFNYNKNKIQRCTWGDLLSSLYIMLNFNIPSKFYLKKYKKVIGLTGSISDLKSIYYFFQFLNNIGSANLQVEENPLFLNIDIPLFYQFNSSIKGIEEGDLFLLVGVNPRYEASILNVRLRKQYMKEDVTIALLGNPVDLTYPYLHLGNSTKTLVEIAEGRHPFCKKLRSAKKPIFIFGTEFLKRKDSKALINVTRNLGRFSILQLKEFNGYNILHSNISQSNACELGTFPGTRSTLLLPNKKKKSDILYLLEAENINFNNWISKKNDRQQTKVVLQSSHKINDLSKIDFLIPSTAPFEKKSLLVNTEGYVQEALKAVTPYGTAKDSIKIFKGLSILFQFKNKSSNFSKAQFLKENPSINNINTSTKKLNLNFLQFTEPANKIYFSIFLPLINNFYMTDIISKNSSVMSECSILLNTKSNFKYKNR